MEDLRERYERAVLALRDRAAEMHRSGASAETVARALHEERRRLAGIFKEMTPEPLRSRIIERTIRVYGDALGPTIDFLRARGKTWEEIADGATRPGSPIS
ncbi:cell wall-binding protein [Bosea sp. BK604]|uniref:cell wall-binding protein n=1 Tax=Bosea sp. BK604 TaxID=2512180 RepID=UPI001047C62D|nr:cell wall-binding protein [Bosea sp. BK604]TCR65522.1 hypothetical protein EV560_105285 [Bosea sp. BK604]